MRSDVVDEALAAFSSNSVFIKRVYLTYLSYIIKKRSLINVSLHKSLHFFPLSDSDVTVQYQNEKSQKCNNNWQIKMYVKY